MMKYTCIFLYPFHTEVAFYYVYSYCNPGHTGSIINALGLLLGVTIFLISTLIIPVSVTVFICSIHQGVRAKKV